MKCDRMKVSQGIMYVYLPKKIYMKQKFKEWRSGEKKLIFMRASDNILVWKLVYYILKCDNGIPTLLMLIVSVNLFKFQKNEEMKKKFDEEKFLKKQ